MGLCSSLLVFLQFWRKGDGGEERATATEISPFTEVAVAGTAVATGTAAGTAVAMGMAAATTMATLRLAGNGLAFRTIYFPSSASFFRFPSYEVLGFFLLFMEIFVSVGSLKWSIFV